MIDKRFSAEAFTKAGIDSDESRKLADMPAEEVASELHQIIEAKVTQIVEDLNSIGHDLRPESAPIVGDISFRDDYRVDDTYKCKLRLAVDTVISTGNSHLTASE
ncbi:hypothetical protein BH10ACI2_BH10ACI2_06220 [soil metagenome]